MRITCVIDSLGSGGAQRQMSMLAVLLKQRGHEVRVVTYYPFDFFKPMLEEVGIPVVCVRFRGQVHRILAVRRAVRQGNPDVAVVYLAVPSFIVEVGSLPWRSYALVVSERSLDAGSGISRWKLLVRYNLHRLADAVVANSHAQTALVRKTAPWLKTRLSTIVNCVDLDEFRPRTHEIAAQATPVRILCVGRFEWVKNYFGLLEALEIVQREHPEIDLVLDAYGNNHYINGKPGPLSGEYLKLKKALEESPARAQFRLHDPVADTVRLYQSSTALCLASFYEGCSNVICEAMACGRPILAARVGDNPVLVEDGKNGFLFDPHSPRDIADTHVRFASLPQAERETMGKQSRKRAERMLDPERFVDQYETLFDRLLNARHPT